VHPSSVFAHKVVGTAVMAESLLRLAEPIAAHGLEGDGVNPAARDLLLRRPPRIAGHDGTPLARPNENGLDAARRLAAGLVEGTLAIQGPPGSGKTYTGARMIADLVRAGKRIGVCANSHKVIENLLEEVVEAAAELGIGARAMRKVSETSAPEERHPKIAEAETNEEARSALASRQVRVLGGTAWLWSRPEFAGSVDVLFVDEAGQLSLATTLAITPAAPALVLLGDPRQLDQPILGSHPPGTAVSALEHVLGEAATIPPDRGLFLEETWRLPPAICAFTSELFYERRLEPHAGLERQAVLGDGPFAGAGLWFAPVAHDANQSASREEVAAIAALVRSLLDGRTRWRDRHGVEAPLGPEDVLVVAPYNAQVADLAAHLPAGVRAGTVDRFQGQEAPVVIYSMTTSTAEDAPRGMEFLYDPNRFNVATSRAKCACIVVGSPRLFSPDCQTPRQIRLANAFCRYLEMAREVRPPAGEVAAHAAIDPAASPA